MSEYQYYEFQAIDRPLSEEELRALRALSSRARITATSFVNDYSWGGFRGDPDTLMEKCFDAFVYLANWGTRRLMLRLPRRLLDLKAVSLCHIERTTKGENVILDFRSEDESGGEWVSGEGWLSSLIPLRADLLNGDLRSLYLGWLLCAQTGELEDDDTEPPAPPGLGSLSGALKGFAEFLRIHTDLIEVAAEQSALITQEDSSIKLAAWVRALPEPDKTEILLRMIKGEDRHLRTELIQKASREGALSSKNNGKPMTQARTVKELLESAERLTKEKKRRAAELEARNRAERLDQLATRAGAPWRQVETLIASRKPKGYDEAVQLLNDLKEVGAHTGRSQQFEERLQQLREQHTSKSGLTRRLARAALVKQQD